MKNHRHEPASGIPETALPNTPDGYMSIVYGVPGLSKLEVAAIAMMQAQISSPFLTESTPRQIALWSVKYADALFDVLEKRATRCLSVSTV